MPLANSSESKLLVQNLQIFVDNPNKESVLGKYFRALSRVRLKGNELTEKHLAGLLKVIGILKIPKENSDRTL